MRVFESGQGAHIHRNLPVKQILLKAVVELGNFVELVEMEPIFDRSPRADQHPREQNLRQDDYSENRRSDGDRGEEVERTRRDHGLQWLKSGEI